MATPLTHAARVAAMQAEGLHVVVLPGAESNNRNHKGAWGPVNGLLVHHTGSNTNDPAGYARFLFGGRSDLPGPLCHDGLAPDGTIYVVGNGRANHAGKGSSATLDRIIAETMPLDAEVRPGPDNVDGNARLYGLEVMYSGSRAMTPEQREAAVKWAAAHCRAHAWSAGSVAGHKEWTASKWDPGQCHMGSLRRDVAARLSTATSQGQPTNPSPQGDDDMTPDQVERLNRALAASEKVAWALDNSILPTLSYLVGVTAQIRAEADNPDRVLTPEEAESAAAAAIEAAGLNKTPPEAGQ